MNPMSSEKGRSARVERRTNETEVIAEINLDGQGRSKIETGIGFLDHMLDQLARHGLMDIKLTARGDLHIDMHHTTEDVGIVLGQAVAEALGDKAGITRFGDATQPMDECLTRVALDISGRPYLVWRVDFPAPKVGDMDTELFGEWFRAFAVNAGITLHVDNFYGDNAHHIAESCFKALARAMRCAVAQDTDAPSRPPSTKGVL